MSKYVTYHPVSRPTSLSTEEKQKDYEAGIAIIVISFLGLLGALCFLAPAAFGNYAKLVVATDALAMAYCLALFIRRKA